MTQSRRDFLRTLGLTAGAAAVLELVDGPIHWIERLEAAPLTPRELESLGAVALDRARALGCSYADIRINRYRTRSVALRTSPDRAAGTATSKVNHVPAVIESERFGFPGVRAVIEPAARFASTEGSRSTRGAQRQPGGAGDQGVGLHLLEPQRRGLTQRSFTRPAARDCGAY